VDLPYIAHNIFKKPLMRWSH